DVLVVDDGSSDGTAELARALGTELGRIDVIERGRRLGIGSAYREGFARGLAQDYDRPVSVGPGLSHQPPHPPALIRASREAGVAIGSRYQRGISVVNWSLKRLALSVGANWYARIVTGLPVQDCTSGFQCFRREVLEAIGVERLRFNGYAFLVEVKYRAHRRG